ncbi:phosphoserine aminotransferase-like [Ylistrum balloti]|uniref:phosphoserine aminotransferase-like n=1 Tax=Ylistrum balloti TaxID=509963 RepID=UPI002905F3BA|nr:phosphoserine aminotransferase-like [Ylistrum balloti]
MVHNFSPGPAAIYKEVLLKAQKELLDYNGTHYSLLEASHRSAMYQDLHQQARDTFLQLLDLDDSYQVLLLSGGATLQFAMLAYNLLGAGSTADYIVTGAWGEKAYEDAVKVAKGKTEVKVFRHAEHAKYTITPAPHTVQLHSSSAYVHITSNETIQGLQWKEDPQFRDASIPVLADMSSDILSRRRNFASYGLIYAGAQKNIGTSGLTVLLIRKDLLSQSQEALPSYLSYKKHATAHSLYNTPPVFSVWVFKLVLDHIISIGGLEAVESMNQKKAEALYEAVDSSNGFYTCPVKKAYRSDMNVVFTLPSTDLEDKFIAMAGEHGIIGIRGHRSVGGCRASLYNAVSLANVEALVACMHAFRRKH